MSEGDFEENFAEQPPSRSGCLAGLAACVLSAAVTCWLAWLAWQAIRDQSPYVLLGVAGILVAAVAFHALRRHWWDHDADVMSQAWMSRHGARRP
jgi:Co/Zn/Cd efflux system component